MIAPKRLPLLLAILAGFPAQGQQVLDCTGYQASAYNLVEPWEAHSATFANGDIRVALLDTVEPAAAAFYLLVIAPPYDELGLPGCSVIAETGGMGFGGLDFSTLAAAYDPGAGLTLSLAGSRFDASSGDFRPMTLALTINQSTGVLTPVVRP
ncbi:hypothetical protein R5H30_21180 [Sulfitobacter sp. D35]|uniref:hypothetical protein n=1 Tax=Sulfitobacter sp. D35 TaxID=3083252 RepID=UPI00296E468B|nr:hypothetical protein [Sulfitobacter sp. D35]MDW4500515.1 hypothetical protein [Sulfitobacter sp. D35]